MIGFKKCANGHYYTEDIERCPYCPNPINADLVDYGVAITEGSRVCSNGHCYISPNECKCPYCEDEKVVGRADMHTGQGYSIIGRSSKQLLTVIVDGKEIKCHDIQIGYWIWDWSSGIKSGYEIGQTPIFSSTKMQIGNTHLTGKEFIKMCDVIIDNQLVLLGM